MPSLTYRTAQAVGLWLAEGDKRTNREVTFTNNEPSLISFFHKVMVDTLQPRYTPRIAVYLPFSGESYLRPVVTGRYRVYIDGRANRPYYIYRISGVLLVRKWRSIVSTTCKRKSNFRPVLQGFFAGESNVKEGSHGSRVVRVAQGMPNRFIEKLLAYFGITCEYGGHREYTIQGRDNLEKILALELMILHPSKQKRFQAMMAGYRQRHYSKNALYDLVYSQLQNPATTE